MYVCIYIYQQLKRPANSNFGASKEAVDSGGGNSRKKTHPPWYCKNRFSNSESAIPLT